MKIFRRLKVAKYFKYFVTFNRRKILTDEFFTGKVSKCKVLSGPYFRYFTQCQVLPKDTLLRCQKARILWKIYLKERNCLRDKFSRFLRIFAKFAKLNPREKSTCSQFAKLNSRDFLFFFSRISKTFIFTLGSLSITM